MTCCDCIHCVLKWYNGLDEDTKSEMAAKVMALIAAIEACCSEQLTEKVRPVPSVTARPANPVAAVVTPVKR